MSGVPSRSSSTFTGALLAASALRFFGDTTKSPAYTPARAAGVPSRTEVTFPLEDCTERPNERKDGGCAMTAGLPVKRTRWFC